MMKKTLIEIKELTKTNGEGEATIFALAGVNEKISNGE